MRNYKKFNLFFTLVLSFISCSANAAELNFIDSFNPIQFSSALLILGAVFMIFEALSPTIGVLGFIGAILFGFGLVILLQGSILAYVIALIIIFIAAVFLVINLVLRAKAKPIVSGIEELTVGSGTIIEVADQIARMRLRGEIWQVNAESPLQVGDKVKVVGREGLILKVVKEEK